MTGIILSPRFPDEPDILVLLNHALLVSRDGGQSWAEWRAGLHFEVDTASIVAPRGINVAAPLLIGLIDGSVIRL